MCDVKFHRELIKKTFTELATKRSAIDVSVKKNTEYLGSAQIIE